MYISAKKIVAMTLSVRLPEIMLTMKNEKDGVARRSSAELVFIVVTVFTNYKYNGGQEPFKPHLTPV